MNAFGFRSSAILLAALLATPGGVAAEEQLDLRNAIPPSAYMAVHGQQNPERDLQREHFARVWQAVQDERLPQRALQIVLNRLPAEGQESVQELIEEVRTILEPIDWSALADCPEVVYGQMMEVPQTHHLFACRMPYLQQALAFETAYKQLGELVVQRSNGAVQLSSVENGTAPVLTLSVPSQPEFPFQPTLARYDNVLIFSTSPNVANASLDSLRRGGPSKFDDPRLTEALTKLPEPEDALIYYSMKDQFEQMAGLGNFIRAQAPDDAKALRVAGILEKIFDQLTFLDYEVTVANTQGNHYSATTRGQVLPGAEDTVFYRVVAEGQLFESWERWVPADAQSFSLSTGANLHALFKGVVDFLQSEIPESQQPLEQFEELQQAWGVHIDRDVLQSFTGRCVSLTLPAATPEAPIGQDSVIALECTNPERIHQLLTMLVDYLASKPFGESQQLRLAPSEELEGFDELSANLLTGFQVRPVIGFHDGWLIVSTNLSAVQKVLATQAGAAPAIDAAALYERFGLDLAGPVGSISYRDLSNSAHQAAQVIRQIGLFAPMAVAMAGAHADPNDLAPVQEVLALLPSVANVVETFDFYDASLKVVVPGNEPGSYFKHQVVTIQQTVDK